MQKLLPAQQYWQVDVSRPPCLLHIPNIFLSVQGTARKSKLPPTDAKYLTFSHICTDHQDRIQIYTDGSCMQWCKLYRSVFDFSLRETISIQVVSHTPSASTSHSSLCNQTDMLTRTTTSISRFKRVSSITTLPKKHQLSHSELFFCIQYKKGLRHCKIGTTCCYSPEGILLQCFINTRGT